MWHAYMACQVIPKCMKGFGHVQHQDQIKWYTTQFNKIVEISYLRSCVYEYLLVICAFSLIIES